MAQPSFISDFAKTAKQEAAKKIGASFGRGLVGRAVGKALVKKFNFSTEDTQVDDAVDRQRQAINDNNATLARMETVVVNISDNVYNIAGILNAQVTSMQETKRLYEMQKSRDLAAQEEAANETSRVAAPAPTQSETTPQTEDKKTGLLSRVVSIVTSQKKGFVSLLKKFALYAGGIAAVSAATAIGGAAVANAGERGEVPGPEPVTTEAVGSQPASNANDKTPEQSDVKQPTPQPAPVPVSPTTNIEPPPPQPAPVLPITNMGPLTPQPAPVSPGTNTQTVTSPVAAPVLSATKPAESSIEYQTKQAPTPLPAPAPPQIVQAPSISVSGTDTPQHVVNHYSNPENAAEKEQFVNLSMRQARAERVKSVAETSLKNAQDEQSKDVYKQVIVNTDRTIANIKKAKEQLTQQIAAQPVKTEPLTASSLTASTSTQAPPSNATAPVSGSGSGSSSPTAQTTDAQSQQAATPIAAAPAVGSDMNAASVAVAAASEPRQTSNETVGINTGTTSNSPSPPTIMPSPVADRGSLDLDTTFNARG